MNIFSFLLSQRAQRYRSFFLLAPAGKGKTKFAWDLAKVKNGAYIDVLEKVANTPELAKNVDLLNPEFLKTIALEAASADVNLVIIDEFDFLLPVWGQDTSKLIEMVRKLSVVDTDSVICFVMRTIPALEKLQLVNTRGESRTLHLNQIDPLKVEEA